MPHVHRRDRHRPRPGAAAALHDPGRARHEGRHRVAGRPRRRRTASSSSSSSTTRSTARCATRAASARCRTRRWPTARARAASSRRSATSRSRSRSATSCYLDRERCILCDRCTRFAKEVAGDPLIHFIRTAATRPQVNTFPDEPFASYFSGNTVQICPVGALTAKPYRFKARPWDLEQIESHLHSVLGRLPHRRRSRAATRCCATRASTSTRSTGAGCATRAASASRPSNSDDRLGDAARARRRRRSSSAPLGRARSAQAAAAIAAAARRPVIGRRARRRPAHQRGRLRLGQAGQGRHRHRQRRRPARRRAARPRSCSACPGATIDEVCAPGGTVLLLGPDLKEELPVLFLRLRHAVVEDGVTVIELRPQPHGLRPLAAVVAALPPRRGRRGRPRAARSASADGDAGGVDADALADAPRALAAADGPRHRRARPASRSPSPPTRSSTPPSALLDRLPGRPVPRRRCGGRNVHGALDMGLAPGLLPGRVTLDDGPGRFAAHVARRAGRDRPRRHRHPRRPPPTGRIDVLVLLGADPLRRLPRPRPRQPCAGRRPHRHRASTCSSTLAPARPTSCCRPPASPRSPGTTTNIEGRVSRAAARRSRRRAPPAPTG